MVSLRLEAKNAGHGRGSLEGGRSRVRTMYVSFVPPSSNFLFFLSFLSLSFLSSLPSRDDWEQENGML